MYLLGIVMNSVSCAVCVLDLPNAELLAFACLDTLLEES